MPNHTIRALYVESKLTNYATCSEQLFNTCQQGKEALLLSIMTSNIV